MGKVKPTYTLTCGMALFWMSLCREERANLTMTRFFVSQANKRGWITSSDSARTVMTEEDGQSMHAWSLWANEHCMSSCVQWSQQHVLYIDQATYSVGGAWPYSQKILGKTFVNLASLARIVRWSYSNWVHEMHGWMDPNYLHLTDLVEFANLDPLSHPVATIAPLEGHLLTHQCITALNVAVQHCTIYWESLWLWHCLEPHSTSLGSLGRGWNNTEHWTDHIWKAWLPTHYTPLLWA